MRKAAYWLSLLLIFVIPWENTVQIPGLGRASKLAGLAAGGFWLLTVVGSGKLRRPLPFHGVLLAFILWNGLSVLWTIDAGTTAQSVMTYLQLFGLVLMVWDLYTTREALRAGLQAYILGTFVSMASLLGNYRGAEEFYSQRFTASGFHPNALGFILALGIPVAWYLTLEGRRSWLTVANYVYLPLAAVSIVLTGSRAAFLAAIPGVMYILVSLGRLTLPVRVVLLVAAVGLFGVVQPYLPQHSLERLGGTGEEIAEGDLNGRLRIWRLGAAVFAEHPFVGIGSGAFASAIETGRAPHNLALSLLVEVGLVGFVLFAILLGIVGLHALRQATWSSRLWMTVLVVWLLAASVHNYEQRKQTWLFLSLVVVSSRIRELAEAPGSVLDRRAHPHALPQPGTSG
jgi:O-antigen ligase